MSYQILSTAYFVLLITGAGTLRTKPSIPQRRENFVLLNSKIPAHPKTLLTIRERSKVQDASSASTVWCKVFHQHDPVLTSCCGCRCSPANQLPHLQISKSAPQTTSTQKKSKESTSNKPQNTFKKNKTKQKLPQLWHSWQRSVAWERKKMKRDRQTDRQGACVHLCLPSR